MKYKVRGMKYEVCVMKFSVLLILTYQMKRKFFLILRTSKFVLALITTAHLGFHAMREFLDFVRFLDHIQ